MMRRDVVRAAGLGRIVLATSGCHNPPTARYVYQDGEFGVVAIPRNSFLDKSNYRAQAEALMRAHFPDGYEIVRAEEVVEGQRILDIGKKTDLATEPSFSALNQMFKLGKVERSTSFEEKDSLLLRESRIVYKRRSPDTPGLSGGFTTMASLGPPLYLDPNEPLRQQAEAMAKAKEKDNGKIVKTDDPETHQASQQSVTPTPPSPSPGK